MINAMRKAREPRPERVVTVDSATVVDRASAWAAVEVAQRLVNELMLSHLSMGAAVPKLPSCLAFVRAQSAYHRLPSGSPLKAAAWREVRAAQVLVNHDAKQSTNATVAERVRELEACLVHYVQIGGAEDRLPGDGGLS